MIKFDIKNRFSGEVMFTASIGCKKSDSERVKVGLSVKWAVENKTNLYGADLRGANLYGADLRGANLYGADLCGVDLYGADLRGANLYGADLCGVDLRGVDLRGVDLRGVDLRGVDLCGADLRGVDLCGVDLCGVDLCGVDLRGVDLRGVDLCGVDLCGVDLCGALIKKDIKLVGKNPVFTMTPIGSENGTLFAFNTDKGVFINRGCFFDTFDIFKTVVEEKHGLNIHGVTYRAVISVIETLWAGE